MSAIRLLLVKDAQLLARTRLLAAALIVYPLLIALVVGVAVRYAGERPRVAFVDEAGLPSVIHVGDRNFDLRGMLEGATEVRLVTMTRAQADRELAGGRTLGTLVIPRDFTDRLSSMSASPKIVLETTRGGLSTRIVEKVRALVYSLNLELQQAFITANLADVELVLRGGSGSIGKAKFTLLGIERAHRQLLELTRSRDPVVAARARSLDQFVEQLRGVVGRVGEFLRATANPIVLVSSTRGGRSWLLSAQIQVYALAVTLAFVAILLAAAMTSAERETQVIGRLMRGIVSPVRIVVEKIVFGALAATAVCIILALVFAVTVEAAGVSGGEPWSRLPLLAAAFVLAAAAFAAFGVLLSTLGRDAGTAMLLAFLLALPLSLLGVVPAGGTRIAVAVGDLFPFGHAAEQFAGVLYDPSPGGAFLHGAAWLTGLTVSFGLLARLGLRRLVA